MTTIFQRHDNFSCTVKNSRQVTQVDRKDISYILTTGNVISD